MQLPSMTKASYSVGVGATVASSVEGISTMKTQSIRSQTYRTASSRTLTVERVIQLPSLTVERYLPGVAVPWGSLAMVTSIDSSGQSKLQISLTQISSTSAVGRDTLLRSQQMVPSIHGAPMSTVNLLDSRTSSCQRESRTQVYRLTIKTMTRPQTMYHLQRHHHQ